MGKSPLYKILPLLLGLPLLMSACRAVQTPTPVVRNFDIVDLLIDVHALPDGWQQKGEPERFHEVGALEAVGVSFDSDNNLTRNGAGIAVFHYGTREEAKRVFYKIFEPSVHNELPPDLNTPPISANQYKIGCYDWEGREPFSCVWAAQYEEFIVRFNTWIIPGFMSFDDVENVVVAIDERMKRYLQATNQ